MLFKLTDQHEQLRKEVREWAEKEVKPICIEKDRGPVEDAWMAEQVKQMGQKGWLGVPYPKEYGGMGLDVISYAIVVEELSRVDGGIGVICSAHTSLGSYPIAAFGNEEQKKKYLTPLAKGEKIGAFGLTEPNAGSDAGGTETEYIDDGTNYILNGGKIFITNAPMADTYVVFAKDPNIPGTHGISAFIVEKGEKGFEFGEHYDKLGIRTSATGELIFNELKLPHDRLLGKEGQGFKIAMQTLDGGRIGIAAQGLGIAQGAYEEAVKYARTREQFGKPIGAQQNLAFKLADMLTKLEASRLLIYKAAEKKEHHEDYGLDSAMAKLFATDSALEIVNDALQIHGGSGFIKGIPVEKMYRDAKITTIYEGTNEIQRLVIASKILGKLGKANRS